MQILPSKKERRINHWKEIQSRTITHEGEFLSGKKGEHYKKKWSKKYLKIDLSRPTIFNKPEYQKELVKTK